MFAQAFVDLATCFLIALLAARLAPERARPRAALAGLWLAALCPFMANYSAVVLTETLATFFTALAILVLFETPVGAADVRGGASPFPGSILSPWFLAGIVAGFGTLVRPETPLVLLAAGLVLLGKWWQAARLAKTPARGAADGRRAFSSARAMGRAQLRARSMKCDSWRLARQLWPAKILPRAWTRGRGHGCGDSATFILSPWKLEDEQISVDDLPPSAFDSPEERARVARLLAKYNDTLDVDPALDNQFGEVARERTARHPLAHVC